MSSSIASTTDGTNSTSSSLELELTPTRKVRRSNSGESNDGSEGSYTSLSLPADDTPTNDYDANDTSRNTKPATTATTNNNNYTNNNPSTTFQSLEFALCESSSLSLDDACAGITDGVNRTIAQWKVLLSGQVISFFLAASAASSASMHLDCNLSAPTFQTSFVYIFMAAHAFKAWGNTTAAHDGTSHNSSFSWSWTKSLFTKSMLRIRRWRTGFKMAPTVCHDLTLHNNLDDVEEQVHAHAHAHTDDTLDSNHHSSTHTSSQTHPSNSTTTPPPPPNGTTITPCTTDNHSYANIATNNPTATATDSNTILSSGRGEILRSSSFASSSSQTSSTNHIPAGSGHTSNLSSSSSPHSLFFGYLPINVPAWCYILCAIVHVESNYFTFLAFRYTTMTSVSILDNLNILSAMILSRIVLRRHYRPSHIIGAMICCLGVGINLLSDYEKSEVDPSTLTNANDQMEEQEYPNRLLGDFFAVLGGLLVGMSDVVIELLVKDFSGNGGTDEYLACVGIFGTIISIIQAAILERSAISKFFVPGLSNVNLADEYQQYDDPYDAPRTCSQSKGLLLLIAYAITSYLFNVGTSRFLAVSESALLTLSILTCDLWAVMFTVFAEHIAPTHLFYIAFVLIVIGVFVYETAPSPLEAEEYEASNQLKLQKSTHYHHHHHHHQTHHHPDGGNIVAVAVDRSDHEEDERDII